MKKKLKIRLDKWNYKIKSVYVKLASQIDIILCRARYARKRCTANLFFFKNLKIYPIIEPLESGKYKINE